MNVLVVGGSGFIGQPLCRELDDRGHDVTALARHPEAADLPASVTTAMGDVTAYDSIEGAFEGQDVVVNLVAVSPLFKPSGGAQIYDRVNREGTRNCLQAAETHDLDRFVQMSGIFADPAAETDFLRTKGEAEELVRASSLEWVIYRPTIVFGDGCEFVDFIDLVTTPVVTGLPGGGEVRYQPIWVEDLVPMLAAGVEDDDRAGDIYEIGGAETITLAEATRLIYRARGDSIRILPVPTPLAKIGLRAMDPLPVFPLGADQARSMDRDLVVDHNDIDAFDVDPADMKTFAEWLGVAPATAVVG